MEEAAEVSKPQSKLSSWINKHTLISFLLVSIIFSFLTVTFSNGLTSFIYQNFRQDYLVNDPEFFYLFANSMLQGKTPYIDLFDHKGLYIFYFHALGILMGDRVGLFFLEVIWFITIYYFLLLTFKEMSASFKTSMVFILIFLVAFIAQFQGGSDEEVELPFLVIPTYFYIRGYVRKDDKSFLVGTILYGVMAGICLNIRPSDAVFALAPCLAYAIYRIRGKKIGLLVRDALLCILAFLLSALPAYLIAYLGGYLNEMIDAVFIDSFAYVNLDTSITLYKVAVFSFTCLAVVLLLLGLVYLFQRIDREEWIYYLTCVLVVGAEQIAVAEFSHYWIMAYPFILLVLLRLLQNLPKKEKVVVVEKVSFGVCSVLFLALALIFPLAYYVGGQYEAEEEAISYVKKYINEEERTSYTICIDCEAGTYNELGIIPQYKHFAMQGWHSLFDEDLIDGLTDYLYSGYCHYVILEDDTETGAEYRAPIRELITGENAPYKKVDQEGEESVLLDIYEYTGEFKEGSYYDEIRADA